MIEFDKKYNHKNFLNFLKNFLPEDFAEKEEEIVIKKERYKEITKAKVLGFSESLDLHVLEMDHGRENDPRIAIATDAFKILADHWIHKALVVFKNKESENYRLSYLTITLDLNDRNMPIKKYSNAHRYSFYLGVNAKKRTPEQQLIKKGRVRDLNDLYERFSIEVVNKEFYKEISKAFTKLVDELLKLPSIQEKSQASIEFGVRLIGRIIFCWFLREKKSKAGFALMPKDLLSFKAVEKNKDYYHKILEPIFFEVLNKQVKFRREDFANKPFSTVPYLNGGLFSPQDDDYYKRINGDFQSQYSNTLVIPDKWFKEFFEILETYNFTIDENTSYDEELSIDPEMLGRIFENLLAEINPETGESARKNTGSYYTPRIIVNYMIDESLLLYLKEKTGIREEKLRAIISYDLNDDLENPISAEEKENIINALEKVKILDPACGSGAFPIGALQKIVFILQQTDPDGQLWFKKQIKNTPPEIRRVVEREFIHKNFDYIRKLGIIRENIYGVDIQPIATEISRLRCFLTLIVDERIQDESENRGIEPLPNLDFKFVTANSLIGLPRIDRSQQSMFDDFQKIEDLKSIRDQYFSASGIEREQLKTEFVTKQKRLLIDLQYEFGWAGVVKAELTNKLSNWEPFAHKSTSWFDPEWMFGIKGGFDIIIANPPYIGERGNEKIFHEVVRSEFGRRYYARWMDYFYFFFHLALEYGSEEAIIAFISTNYYLTATGGKKLREDFKLRSHILRLINFNELKIFENALGQHNIITILSIKNNSEQIAKTCITTKKGVAKSEDLRKIIEWNDVETEYCSVDQDQLYEGSDYQIRLGGTVSNNNQPNITNILSKIKSNYIPLGMLVKITMGIVTLSDTLSEKHLDKFPKIKGKKGDGIYVLSEEELRELDLSELEKIKYVRPFYKNSDIKHYYARVKNTHWLIYIKDAGSHIELELALRRHFEKYKELMVALKENFLKNKIAASIVKKWLANDNYFVLFTPKKERYFTAPKIIAPYRSKENYFAYNEIPWFGSKDVAYILPLNLQYSLKFILAILNSKLIFKWLCLRGKRKGETLELYQKPLSEIPIRKVSRDEQKPFIEIVDKILILTKDEMYLRNPGRQSQVKEYQKQIDKMVYELYDLTPEEIAIVEGGEK